MLVPIVVVQSSFTSPYATASHGDFAFSIEVTPKDAQVVPGGIATFDITITRITGSFPTISLDLEDISGSWDPAIKYWFEPYSGVPSFSSKLNIATSTAAGGVYGFKIDFTEEGHDSPFTSEYITLRVGGEAFDFGIKAEPSYLRVAQGDSAYITVDVSLLKGNAQPVSLSPGDVLQDEFLQHASAWFGANAKPPPFSSVLTIVVLPDAPLGEHTLNIFGWWENVSHEIQVTVIVEKKQTTVTEKEKIGGDLEPSEKISTTGNIGISGNEFSLPSYKQTTPVKIFGKIEGYGRGTPITIEVINPDGSVENFSIIGSKDGDYELQYYLTDTSQAGEYTAVVKYQDFWASISFSVVEKEEKKTISMPAMPPQILFDRESFSANDVGALIVVSPSDDLDPNTIESIKVKLWSSTDPNGLFLVLRETGPNTAIFETDFSLATNRPSSGNVLRVSTGDNITAEYGGGSSTLVIEEKIAGKSGFNFIIYDKPLPPAPVGKYYSYSFCDPKPSTKLLCGGLIEQDINNPVGGVQPYTFQKETLLEIGGNIPFGLKLNPSGVLEGTPIKADAGKTFKFKICAIDNTRSFVCDKTSLKVVEKTETTKITGPSVGEYTSCEDQHPGSITATTIGTFCVYPVDFQPYCSSHYTGSEYEGGACVYTDVQDPQIRHREVYEWAQDFCDARHPGSYFANYANVCAYGIENSESNAYCQTLYPGSKWYSLGAFISYSREPLYGDLCGYDLEYAAYLEEPLSATEEEPSQPLEEEFSSPPTVSGDIDSWTTKDGKEGEICNPTTRPDRPCKKLSGPVQEGDIIKTGDDNYVIIPLDGGRTQIWLGPDNNIKVWKISEDERIFLIFDLPYQMRVVANTPEGVKSFFAICSDEALEADDCSMWPITFWLVVTGTEFTLDQNPDGTTRLTVLEGEVQVWKQTDEGIIVPVATNEQLILEKDIPLVTNTIDPSSIDRWWVEAEELKEIEEVAKPPGGGGCLIATATYGSELASQVQILREIRDNKVLKTESGSSFMNTFNQFYYSFSPTIADWERQNPVFKEAVTITITPLITILSLLQHVDINSEYEILGYGISLILLNMGIYFVVPALVVLRIFKHRI